MSKIPRAVAVTLALCGALGFGAHAAVDRTVCKDQASAVKRLARELSLDPEATGREIKQAVEAWLAGKEQAAIKSMAQEIEQVTGLVQECEAGGLSAVILPIKGTSLKLRDAVLPWLRNAAEADSCQGLVNEAVRLRAVDIDGAIALLQRSIGECTDDAWKSEAQVQLAASYYARAAEAGDPEAVRQAHAATREALRLHGGREAADPGLVAALARTGIEAGKALVELRAWEAAKLHWTAYIEDFGAPSFDVLFNVPEAAQGAWPLREMKDARYQIVVACLALADLECVRGTMTAAAAEAGADVEALRDVTRLVFERAASASGAAADAEYALAFDLLTAWQGLEPDSYQIDTLLRKTLVEPGRDARLALLAQVDDCWVTVRVVELLRRDAQDFSAELERAATCGGAGSVARQQLAAYFLVAANERLDRVPAAGSADAQRAQLGAIEAEFLPQLGDAPEAEELRRRLAEARGRLRDQSAQAAGEKNQAYAACMELLATIQWNQAREEEYAGLIIEFKRECCPFLRANAEGWVQWMRSRPERERLKDAEIENKARLMRGYCDTSGSR